MVVIDPIWSAAPPESVHAFFVGTPFAQALARFHLNPLLLVGEICLFGALISYWNAPSLRKWILITVGIHIIVIVGTIFYVYPINAVLIQGGGTLDATAIQKLTQHWLLADRIRLVFKLAALLCLLRALSLPIRRGSEVRA